MWTFIQNQILGMKWLNAIKPKLLGTFIVICTVGIILVGYAFNAIVYLLRMSAIKCQG